MTTDQVPPHLNTLRIVRFFLIAYLLSWAAWVALFGRHFSYLAGFGLWLDVAAVLGPHISAALNAFGGQGRAGLRDLYWRMSIHLPVKWIIIAISVPPIIYLTRDLIAVSFHLRYGALLYSPDINALRRSSDSAVSGNDSSPNAGTLATSAAFQGSSPPQPPKTPPPSGSIPAVAPIRVLQLEPSKREGFVPAIKIGENVRITPYGLFKASAVYDTSSPYGNDFPLPGFNAMPNTVDAVPEFHVKARFFRFGSNFEWLNSPNLIITGKAEADFEGNFSRANNRTIQLDSV